MRRILVAVVLATSLTQPAFFEPFWALLSSWSGVFTDAGCGFDPYGGCVPEQSDAGCGMDPNGRCTPDTQENTDAGCGWDPYGCPNS